MLTMWRWLCVAAALLQQAAPLSVSEINVPKFCAECGGRTMAARTPPGDERPRAVCGACGYVAYENPKVVVAVVARAPDGKVLLAKRAIEPRLGTWGVPQGFMELGETTREAAAREAFEETGAVLNPSEMALLALYNLPGQVQVVYEAPLPANAKLETSTTESSEIKLFEESAALEADLCFPTVTWALERCFSSLDRCRGVQERTKAFQGGEWRVLIDDDGGGYLAS